MLFQQLPESVLTTQCTSLVKRLFCFSSFFVWQRLWCSSLLISRPWGEWYELFHLLESAHIMGYLKQGTLVLDCLFVCWLDVCLFVCWMFVCLFIGWLLMWTSFSGRHHCTLLASCSKNPPWRIVGRKEKCPIFSISCSLTQSPVSRLSSSNPRLFFFCDLCRNLGWENGCHYLRVINILPEEKRLRLGPPKNYTIIAKLYRGLYRV